jgi:hypothetical protein
MLASSSKVSKTQNDLGAVVRRYSSGLLPAAAGLSPRHPPNHSRGEPTTGQKYFFWEVFPPTSTIPAESLAFRTAFGV